MKKQETKAAAKKTAKKEAAPNTAVKTEVINKPESKTENVNSEINSKSIQKLATALSRSNATLVQLASALNLQPLDEVCQQIDSNNELLSKFK